MNSRHAKPEQQFFDDPAIDRLMASVMALAMEVFVLQSRLRALEGRLGESGVVDMDDLHGNGEDLARQAAEAKAYSEHLLRPLLGLQDALGPTD
ncbi:MAG: hypothetical protein ACREQZ_15170 [Woeseiaceae bacterium]